MEMIRINKFRLLTIIVLLAVLSVVPEVVVSAKTQSYSFGLRVESIWLYKGKRRRLYVYNSASEKVTEKIKWKSSKPEIAKVNNNGLLIPRKTGITKITATMPDKKSISIKVSVISVRIIGHRGMKTHAPQNTSVSMEIAAEAGCWGVEADVRETGRDADGNTGFILEHNENIRSMTGINAKVSDMSEDELTKLRVTGGINASKYKTTLCSLDEFLDTCNKCGLIPFIDIKNHCFSNDGIKLMIDTLYQKNLLKKVRFVSSKLDCFAALKEYSEKKYNITPKIQMNTKNGNYKGLTVTQQLKLGKANGYFGYSLYHNDVTAKVSRFVTKYNKTLTLWTVRVQDKSKLLKRLSKYNIHSVMVEGIY